jgi:hypothetical protein
MPSSRGSPHVPIRCGRPPPRCQAIAQRTERTQKVRRVTFLHGSQDLPVAPDDRPKGCAAPVASAIAADSAQAAQATLLG